MALGRHAVQVGLEQATEERENGKIGQDRRIKQAWWRRILGPGWLGFFRYSFLSYPEGYHPGGSRSISDKAGGSGQQIRIWWTLIAILIYWWICLVLAIGGWTTYLVRKQRSGIRHPHLSQSPELGRWSGWGSAWKNRIGFRLSRSSSRPRSNSPSTTAAIPPSATTPTTLTGSIREPAGTALVEVIKKRSQLLAQAGKRIPNPNLPIQPITSSRLVPRSALATDTDNQSVDGSQVNLIDVLSQPAANSAALGISASAPARQPRTSMGGGLITARQPPWRTPIRTPGADWRAGLHARRRLACGPARQSAAGELACSWRAGLHAQL
ncbi:hypothetical protein PGTUg99_025960 [Puccinia graminis f. sp. tritici]|uniref:Uncharacterized protein n=1 Tax=Puccinia graminis f. sp. tritici TaxID=56615 RepID=A0A5B0R6P9_PUCGR|nr:hypothetical protein PGTUg99_025960 [Puccinia graminis f. sp. tritici]